MGILLRNGTVISTIGAEEDVSQDEGRDGNPRADQTNSTADLASAYQEQATAMVELNAGMVSMKLIALESSSVYQLCTYKSHFTVFICSLFLFYDIVTSLLTFQHASRQIFTATTVSVSRIPKDATVSGIARTALTNSNAQV
nr:unnamed protein product [Callosobruchus analis]